MGSASDSGVSYSHGAHTHESDIEVSTEEERYDDVQLPAQLTPYCQRCNREFRTINGLHLHNRMSSLHPWYCSSCRLDHDREDDLVRHNTAVHSIVPHSGGQQIQRPPPPPTVVPNRAPLSWMDQLLAPAFGGLTIRDAADDPDISTSTIGPITFTTVDVPPAQNSPLIRDNSEFRPDEASAAGPSGTSRVKPPLGISCPLCLDDVTSLTTTLCGHVFCKECITAAIEHKPECPVCRAFTHIRSLHPIFLNIITS